MIIFNAHHPWCKHELEAGTVFTTASIEEKSCLELLSKLNNCPESDIVKNVNEWLEGAVNHFAIICKFAGGIVAAADRTASYPVYISKADAEIKISNHARSLVSDMASRKMDADGIRSLEMAGYTIGQRSAVKGLHSLRPGEACLINKNRLEYWRYHKYLPNITIASPSTRDLRKELAETTLSILDGVRDRANGRQIVIPLSAGLDSRLIVSGLKHLGTKNLVCFSYGLKNNFEAKAAKIIADTLGVDWHFVPLSVRQQRQFYTTPTYQNYLKFTHNYTSTPFQQDLYPLHSMLMSGTIDKDALVVNGNSGDFISGGHIPASIRNINALTGDAYVTFIDEFLKKNLSLWVSRFSPEQCNRMGNILRSDVETDGLLDDNMPAYAIWEWLELVNRQSKYVISGQRIYDFLNLDWELPLWQDAYLDFWAKVPLSLKTNQILYKDMLLQENWGGVWDGIPINQKVITPRWIIPLRFIAKAACAPFGKKTWHQVEKRFFAYWMDWGGNFAITPYWKLATSTDVARNSVAVHTQPYIERIEAEMNR
jgi:asparagine synthase (glutamine-hydrolysing)